MQFFSRPARIAYLQPEHRLMAAILDDAIDAYRGMGPERPDRRRAATSAAALWFASDDKESPFSFENVCDVLGLSPPAVRSALARRHVNRVRRRPVRKRSRRRGRRLMTR